MKILVLNSGSSSVKYKLIDTATDATLAEGGAEKLGLADAFVKYKRPDGTKATVSLPAGADHKAAVNEILRLLTDPAADGPLKSLSEIEAVGHRVVHGAEKFAKSVLITEEVKDMLRQCYPLAPLHNPANIVGIEAMEELLPGVPQVGVFDTAFHQTMEPKAFLYPLPYEYYTEDGVRRYGFHGTSHRYVSMRAAELLGRKPEELKLITCHIGNGGSITAVQGGKSVDTTMGLTPVEGLMMGTRSGDVDPGALIYLMKRHNLTPDQLSDMLNKRSGMAAISGISNDMREIEAAVAQGHPRAILALEMYIHRIIKYIGAFAAEMGGVDAIIFTGGVGENQTGLRADVCRPLAFMGVELDEQLNATVRGTETLISAPGSRVKVLVVPTDEELMIARDTAALAR